MVKSKPASPTILITIGVSIFLLILGLVFYFTYQMAQKTTNEAKQQIVESNREGGEIHQQIRRLKLTSKTNGESMEILMDGTVNYFDKDGKLIKTGKRGFAETQNLFKRYEWLINNKKNPNHSEYYVEIETQTGITTYNPVDQNQDNDDLINDTVDFVDHTLNPTPTPSPTLRPSNLPTPSATASPSPSPTPLPDKPDYLSAPPFDCSDYHKDGGKPLKISNIYCGIE